MTNFNVVEKLIGNIRPIGKTEVDEKRLENLKAMCQKCHNNYDKKHRRETARNCQ